MNIILNNEDFVIRYDNRSDEIVISAFLDNHFQSECVISANMRIGHTLNIQLHGTVKAAPLNGNALIVDRNSNISLTFAPIVERQWMRRQYGNEIYRHRVTQVSF